MGELVVEMDQGEYVQQVRVRGPEEVFEQVTLGGRVRVAGRIGELEDGGRWSILEWTAGGGIISVRTFRGTFSHPRGAQFALQGVDRHRHVPA